MGIGESLALTAAACWALSSIIYARAHLSAWNLNFAKNIIGTVLVLLHLCVLWIVAGHGFLGFGWQTWIYLVVSGLIGIALGDTCYFRSMQILGPRRTLVVASFAPMFGAIFGWLILGEILSPMTLVGIVVAIAGIAMVVTEPSARQESPGRFPGRENVGILLGLAAAICQGTAGAISKLGMQECTPLEATFVRLFAASCLGLIVAGVTRRLRSTGKVMFQPETFKRVLPAAALGTWIGIWFAQIGFKHADVAIATMLMSTSPLFAIPFVRMLDGTRVSLYSVVGTTIAILGIVLALFV